MKTDMATKTAPLPFDDVNKVLTIPTVGKRRSPDLRYRFDQLFVYPENKLAVDMAREISISSEKPTINPVVFVGPEGSGKTHLCTAIAKGVEDRYSSDVVKIISKPSFQLLLDQASHQNIHFSFDTYLHRARLVILDDFHVFCKTVEEEQFVMRLLGYLISHTIPTVITFSGTLDAIPDMPGVMDLRQKKAKSVYMGYPDALTRMRILNRFQSHQQAFLQPEVNDYLAYHTHGSIKELEGLQTTLLAIQRFQGRKALVTDAMRLVDRGFGKKEITSHFSIDYILKTVSKYFHLLPQDLLKKTRRRDIAQARQIAMYFTKEYTNYTYAHIGSLFGGKNHATVMHACKTVTDLNDNNREFQTFVSDIRGIMSDQN